MYFRAIAALGILGLCLLGFRPQPVKPQAPAPQADSSAAISHELLDFLATIQLETPSEMYGCLVATTPTTIGAVFPVRLYERTRLGVRHDPCPLVGPIVGEWHTHIVTMPCDFSNIDTDTFRKSKLPVSLLACGYGQFKYLLQTDTLSREIPGYYGFERK